MATENEVKILITAVDNATKILERIEKQVVTGGKQMQQVTDNTAKSFDKQMGSLLVLGDAATKVDRIFDSYQNLQLRLENSSERLANAQDRLRKSQYSLSKVQKDTTSSAEDLAEAQADVTSASRGLTIAQNNLAKTQNQVVGTYIGMASQSVSLLRSFPLLVAEINAMTTASLRFIATPIGAVLTAIGIAAGIATVAYQEHKKELEEIAIKQQALDESQQRVADSQRRVTDETYQYNTALNTVKSTMMGFIIPQSTEELSMLKDIEYQKGLVAKAKLQGDEDEIVSQQSKLDMLMLTYDAEFSTKRSYAEAWVKWKENSDKVLNENEQKTMEQNAELYKQPFEKMATWLESTWKPQVLETLNLQKDIEIYNQIAEGMLQEFIKTEPTLQSTPTFGGAGTSITSFAPKAEVENRPWWQRLFGINTSEDPTLVAQRQFQNMTTNMNTSQVGLATNLSDNLGFMISSPTKGSYPIVYSLIQAETEWNTMGTVANQNINDIILNLNKIPKEIVTIHRIITVYESSGSKSGGKK